MMNLKKTSTACALVLGVTMTVSLIDVSAALAQSVRKCDVNPKKAVFPCRMGIGHDVNSEVEYLTKRLEHHEDLVRSALANVQQANGDQIEDDKDVLARANYEKMQQLAQHTRRQLAEARANPRQKSAAQQRAEQQERERQAQAERQERERQAQAEADRQAREAEQRRAERRAERQAEREAERRAERQRRRAERRAAAQAAINRTDGVVETESLRREDVRASDEEFATGVNAGDREGRDGLSKFEQALLLGLGAVAVGSILDNGDEIVSRSGDRVVVRRDGELRVLKDDDALLRQPGNDVRTETFNDGSTRTVVSKPDGSRVVTVRSADGVVMRRVRQTANGDSIVLFDDTQEEVEVTVNTLPQVQPRRQVSAADSEAQLRRALQAEAAARQADQRFSLRQVREIEQVRQLSPEIELSAIQFATGSAAIRPEQARSLSRIGNALRDLIRDDPRTVILVEGHTDAVGDATYNLALSDRRAETVALALTEYFGVPPENMITQGYGEAQLKVLTLDAEQANRRAVVRNITGLLRM